MTHLSDTELIALMPKVQLKDEDPKAPVWLTRKDAITFARSVIAELGRVCDKTVNNALLDALKLCYEHCLVWHPEVEHNNVGESVRSAIAAARPALSKCSQCNKDYRQGATGCPKCAKGVYVQESEFQKPIQPIGKTTDPTVSSQHSDKLGSLNLPGTVISGNDAWNAVGELAQRVDRGHGVIIPLQSIVGSGSAGGAQAQSSMEFLLREMRHIAGISTGQVKRVADQALEAVKQAQPERAHNDAERYRWLRAYLPSSNVDHDDALVAASSPEEVDAAIDAAIKQGGQP